MPLLAAMITASTRLFAPMIWKIADTCAFTVPSERAKRLAMTLLDLPCSNNVATSCWRGDKRANAPATAPATVEPDFRTVSDFRKRHLGALSGLFVQVLKLCRQAGLAKLGHVALDGTKVKANASKHKSMSYKRLGEKPVRLVRSPCLAARARGVGPHRPTVQNRDSHPRPIGGEKASGATAVCGAAARRVTCLLRHPAQVTHAPAA